MPHCPQVLLQLLQQFIKQPNQIKQIHSLLITNGHLLYNPNLPSPSKWKSTLLFNALIRAHLSSGQSHNTTLLLFTLMLAHQVPPNNYTFPSLLKAASSSLSLASLTGTQLHNQALKRGILSDPFVQTSLLSVYAQLGDSPNARKVFEEMSNPCVVEYNAMIDAFGKSGDISSAVFYFNNMIKRDIVSWTSVINGFVRNGKFGEAISFFRKMMVHEDIMGSLAKPNEATYVSVLSSCANLDGRGGLYHGKQIHGYIFRNEAILTVFMGTALIDFYGKAGCVEGSMNVFNQMPVKEVCTWNALISSLAGHGREKQALDMFDMMKLQGFYPNEVTFVAVLTSCARAKLVELGLELFQSMHQFEVVPTMEIYGCVVDLLGRAGLLRKATEFLNSMPFEPDASVLGALLGACKIHGATDLGNEVGRRLLALRTQHGGLYVALSNINAGVEKWREAADIRKVMVEAGIRKVPAYSWIGSKLDIGFRLEQFV